MENVLSKTKPSWVQGASLLVLLVVVAYFPTFQNFYIWDDDRYLTQNPFLTDIAGLKRIWFDLNATPQYYPMVFTSFWIEHKFWGLDPVGYHIDNVVIHCVNTLLLWHILVFLNIKGGWLGAALFAIHPVQVESVAWVTERKNVLSGLFLLLSLLSFFRFYNPVQGLDPFVKSAKLKVWSTYGISMVLFIFALLSKTVTCTLPGVILLIFWWKQNCLRKNVFLFTLPYYFIGLFFAFLTVKLEKFNVGAMGQEWDFSLVDRVLIAGRVLWFYIGNLLFPFPLIFTYPRWVIDDGVLWQYLYPLTFLTLLFILWFLRNIIGRGPLTGMLLYAGTLLPALGFFNVYPMRFSFVADHFQYLACISLIVPFSWGLIKLTDLGKPYVIRGLVSGLLIVFGSLTWNQSHVYRDAVTLWKDTTKKNPGAWMAHYNLGLEYANAGEASLAAHSYGLAVKFKPNHYKAHFNLGNSYQILGNLEGAVESYKNALKVKPEHFKSWVNMGIVLSKLKKTELAIRALNKASELKPDRSDVYFNLGVIYFEGRQFDKAKHAFEKVLQIDPDDREALNAIHRLAKKD